MDDGAGATSLAMRASMKVTNVKETLWAGEYDRHSRTHACVSSQDKGGCLAFSRATIWEFIFFQTSAVMIPSSNERRKTVRVSLMISKRWSEEISGSKMVVRDSLASKASRTHTNKGARCSCSCSVHVSGLKGHPGPWSSLAHEIGRAHV